MDFLNIIVESEHVRDEDRVALFPDDEVVHILRDGHGKDMFDLLIILGAFSSKSQAKKNWKNTKATIPSGWSEFFVGKKKRWLCIWNPTW